MPSAEFEGEISLFDKHSSNSAILDISQVFHCDGLLLCTIKEETRIVVWNPCTGQTKQSKFEICEIKSNLWRTLDLNIDCQLVDTEYRVSLRGKTYWFAGYILSTSLTTVYS
ncbi:PREDICTED: putative F-box protein At3g49980 [Brassica oleracea var. oleracea]|uniref:putative F-box protein At3g49980 n=1 Tax=Brassica oleracea var. oleracea TaxID=109376 RepID=UPI0006A6C26C|nr:PREDICTED: putative F-box protein At3g49980 [Brassica oleracea var. oleracea]